MVAESDQQPVDPLLAARAAEALRSRLHECGIAVCISGVDGSGKTTLARALVRTLEISGVSAQCLHVYQWYMNIFVIPILLVYNRKVGRKILILDRSIFDNMAVAASKINCPRWLGRGVLALVLSCYPGFDYRLYLVAPFGETLRRRPSTGKRAFAVTRKIYKEIAHRAHCTQLRSDTNLLATVLHGLAAGA